MKTYLKFLFIFLLAISMLSCETFFTNSWFQGAADYSNITPEEAINSGDPAITQQVFDHATIYSRSEEETL